MMNPMTDPEFSCAGPNFTCTRPPTTSKGDVGSAWSSWDLRAATAPYLSEARLPLDIMEKRIQSMSEMTINFFHDYSFDLAVSGQKDGYQFFVGIFLFCLLFPYPLFAGLCSGFLHSPSCRASFRVLPIPVPAAMESI
ncbi:hypothetical protein BDW68DRAFT_14364 [Aspergillus falconensis]